MKCIKQNAYTGMRLLFFAGGVLIAAWIAPGFNHMGMYFNILTQSSLLGIQSLGMLFVLLLGHVDLSIGAQTALYGIVCTELLRLDMPTVIAVLLTLGGALLLGCFHGWSIYTYRLNSMISTIGTSIMLTGITYILAKGFPIFKIPSVLERVTAWRLWRLSCSAVIFAIMVVIAMLILSRTYWGKFFYAIGFDEQAAERSGVPVRHTYMLSFALSSIFCAIGAILYVGRIGVAAPNVGEYFLADILTVAALGGVSFSGGRGKALPVACAAIFLTMLTSLFVALQLATYYQNVIKGIILFVAMSTKFKKC